MSEKQFEYEWDLQKQYFKGPIEDDRILCLARHFFYSGKYYGRAEKFREMQDTTGKSIHPPSGVKK